MPNKPATATKPSFRFNFRQSQIECARGTLKQAAMAYGDSPTGIRLWQCVQALTALRDPEVVAFFEAKRMRQTMTQKRSPKARQQAREATNG